MPIISRNHLSMAGRPSTADGPEMKIQPPPSRARPADDYYPTPESAVRALLSAERFEGLVWEPACGDGAISRVLLSTGLEVASSDLHDHGYGHSGYDFLSSACDWSAECIVTNPPYILAEAFIRKAVDRATHKVAMLLRLAFLESQRRRAMFAELPLARVHVFSRRLTMSPGGTPTKSSGKLAFAWFIWEHGHSGAPRLGWI